MPISQQQEYTPAEILDLPVPENAYAADTIGQYLMSSLAAPLRDGKSGYLGGEVWRNVILTAFVQGRATDGVLQNDGTIYSAHEGQTKGLIETLLDFISTADYSTLKAPEPSRNWYVVDTEIDEITKRSTIIELLSGPHTEEEALEDKEKHWNSYLYKDTSTVIQIDLPVIRSPKAPEQVIQ